MDVQRSFQLRATPSATSISEPGISSGDCLDFTQNGAEKQKHPVVDSSES